MSGFRFVDAAIDELENAAAFYAAQSERISLDLRDEISRALGHLMDFQTPRLQLMRAIAITTCDDFHAT